MSLFIYYIVCIIILSIMLVLALMETKRLTKQFKTVESITRLILFAVILALTVFFSMTNGYRWQATLILIAAALNAMGVFDHSDEEHNNKKKESSDTEQDDQQE